MAFVSVCACTFRRPHIAETVRSILAQQVGPEDRFEIVVIDDDPELSAQGLIAQLAATASAPVRYVVSGARNVSAARNAALDAAEGEWIAFIDDDEIAAPGWLAALLRVQAETGADIVKGYVEGVYPDGTPDWVRKADPYTRDYGADGETPAVLASGNVLFRHRLAAQHGVRFDAQFGRSGGEDTDFFHRFAAIGARAAASRSAVVREIVPAERVSPAYLRARNRRAGQTDGRKAVRGGYAVKEGAVALAAAALTWLHPLMRPFNRGMSFRMFAKLWYSVGMLEGLAGRATEVM